MIKKIIGGTLLALCVMNTGYACDVQIASFEEKMVNRVHTSHKLVRTTANTPVVVTRIDMAWNDFVQNGALQGMASNLIPVRNDVDGKSFIDKEHRYSHFFLKNVDNSTLSIVGENRSVMTFISDMSKCNENDLANMFGR